MGKIIGEHQQKKKKILKSTKTNTKKSVFLETMDRMDDDSKMNGHRQYKNINDKLIKRRKKKKAINIYI